MPHTQINATFHSYWSSVLSFRLFTVILFIRGYHVYKSTPRLGQILTTSPEDYNPKDNFSVAMKLLEKIVARPHAKRSRGMESRSFKYLT